jgi:membrane protein implicated in regulation of membrane protease activity
MNMMYGIEVLNVINVPNGDLHVGVSVLLMLFNILLMAFLIAWLFTSEGTKKRIVLACSSVLSIVSLILLTNYFMSPSDIKQYQVTISDHVSMVEFNERYDVIDVEGKIWTIREKESE